MSRSSRSDPPALARYFLEVTLPADTAEFVIGDIEESYPEVLAASGRRAAARWYWRQAWSAVSAVARDRWIRTKSRGHFGREPNDKDGARKRTDQQRRLWEGKMGNLGQDVLFALRTLARRPSFAVVAVFTLALGIGANTAIFSVVDGVLLSELPLPDSDDLVSIWTYDPEDPESLHNNSGPNIRDWQLRAEWFSGVYAYGTDESVYTNSDGLTDMLPIVNTSFNVLDVVGVRPTIGRGPTSVEEGEGSPDVVVLSAGLWANYFGSDPAVLGQTMELDGRSHEIIGVMPDGFELPNAPGAAAIVPWNVDIDARGRDLVWLGAVGRLREGTNTAQAQAAMDGLHAAISSEFPAETVNTALRVVGAKDDVVGDVKPALYLLLGATAFLLLMACANIANLLLVRTTARSVELAVRRSLGASRGRVVRQLLTESLVLAVAAGIAGAGLAFLGKDLLLALAPEGLPRLDQVAVDMRVLAFAVVIMMATGVAFGLLPALLSTRDGPAVTIGSGGRGTVSSRRGRRTRNFLVGAQIAIAAVLMVGAGLLAQSFSKLTSLNPGYDVEGVVSAELNLPPYGYEDPAQRRTFLANLIRGAEALPGAEVAGITLIRPLSPSRINYDLRIDGRPIPEPGEAHGADLGIATEGYFEAFRIPLVQGRSFGPQDTPDVGRVAVISESLAAQAFPNEDPIGQRVALVTGDWSEEPSWREVVGVVGDVRSEGLAIDPNPMIYTNALQQPQSWGNLVVRASVDPGRLVAPLRELILEAEPRTPVPTIQTMNVVKRESLAAPRFYATLLGAFAGLALLLASVGIYGVLSFTVAARTAEIGVRVSFGAERSNIVWMVLREGMIVAVAGIAAGLAGALALSRAMQSLVFGISAADPLTFVGISVMLAVVASAACMIPALRAASVDPSVALRGD